MLLASVFDANSIKQKKCPLHRNYAIFPVLFFVNMYFLIHLVCDFIIYPEYPENSLLIYAYLILPGILLTVFFISNPFTNRFLPLFKRLPTVLIGLAACSFFYQGSAYLKWIKHSHTTTEQVSHDLSAVLSPGAVLAGPYGPRLALNSEFASFIYYFGLTRPDTSIFDSYPITHVAVDISNLRLGITDFPEIDKAMIVTDYLIRSRTILILLMPDSPPEYNLSLYERAEKHLKNNNLDSALVLNTEFRTQYMDNLSGYKQAFRIFAASGKAERVLETLNEIYRKFPDNMDAVHFCALEFKRLGNLIKNNNLILISLDCLKRLKWHYYEMEDYVQKNYDEL